jgi:hypothetical protein
MRNPHIERYSVQLAPNSIILTHLMKHGYLSNTNEFSSLSFDRAPCKLGKSKFLPFLCTVIVLLHVLKLFILMFGYESYAKYSVL